ncbi:hypothetical protein JQC92_09200 [Shewanella sp. 202IG2-18]|uniref:hypothetical protein n=1 Tax=Parashewanella hymeniacidonis TaxID=2807618 RepID=UPI0019603699|nr:hypothetical protein [Parashewanella hymeniacidonis]MBM7072201.1 hypothetical protein [Parashewanella hymeniacidonis]
MPGSAPASGMLQIAWSNQNHITHLNGDLGHFLSNSTFSTSRVDERGEASNLKYSVKFKTNADCEVTPEFEARGLVSFFSHHEDTARELGKVVEHPEETFITITGNLDCESKHIRVQNEQAYLDLRPGQRFTVAYKRTPDAYAAFVTMDKAGVIGIQSMHSIEGEEGENKLEPIEEHFPLKVVHDLTGASGKNSPKAIIDEKADARLLAIIQDIADGKVDEYGTEVMVPANSDEAKVPHTAPALPSELGQAPTPPPPPPVSAPTPPIAVSTTGPATTKPAGIGELLTAIEGGVQLKKVDHDAEAEARKAHKQENLTPMDIMANAMKARAHAMRRDSLESQESTEDTDGGVMSKPLPDITDSMTPKELAQAIQTYTEAAYGPNTDEVDS